MGIATGALAVSMIGGGTYAYFSDTETSVNTFAAGTLNLSLNPQEIINVQNIKPGDWMNRSFKLKNDGSLDIASVLLHTDYEVIDSKGDNSEDLGKYIRVNFIWNKDKATLPPTAGLNDVVFSTTLADLKTMTPDAVANKVFIPFWEEQGGLKVGNTDELFVQYEFVENGKDQNQFQADSLKLTWKFEAKQGAGVSK